MGILINRKILLPRGPRVYDGELHALWAFITTASANELQSPWALYAAYGCPGICVCVQYTYIYIYIFISVCVYMHIDNPGINTSPEKTAAVGIEGERGGFAPKCSAWIVCGADKANKSKEFTSLPAPSTFPEPYLWSPVTLYRLLGRFGIASFGSSRKTCKFGMPAVISGPK